MKEVAVDIFADYTIRAGDPDEPRFIVDNIIGDPVIGSDDPAELCDKMVAFLIECPEPPRIVPTDYALRA